jgi:hypothetical protein
MSWVINHLLFVLTLTQRFACSTLEGDAGHATSDVWIISCQEIAAAPGFAHEAAIFEIDARCPALRHAASLTPLGLLANVEARFWRSFLVGLLQGRIVIASNGTWCGARDAIVGPVGN